MQWRKLEGYTPENFGDQEQSVLTEINGQVTKIKDLFWDKQTLMMYIALFVFIVSVICIAKSFIRIYSKTKTNRRKKE